MTRKGYPPLMLHTDHWRSRWLRLADQYTLHRVSTISWEDGEMIRGEGRTVCGLSGYLEMPGMFSRMYEARCPDCCALLNIPNGNGAPFNSNIADAEDRQDE